MSVVDRIKSLCNERGITLAELERNTGIGNGIIARWKSSSPKADSLEKVAVFFSVSTDYILERTDIRNFYESAAASSTTSYDDLPPEAIQELNNYREFLKQKYGKK